MRIFSGCDGGSGGGVPESDHGDIEYFPGDGNSHAYGHTVATATSGEDEFQSGVDYVWWEHNTEFHDYQRQSFKPKWNQFRRPISCRYGGEYLSRPDMRRRTSATTEQSERNGQPGRSDVGTEAVVYVSGGDRHIAGYTVGSVHPPGCGEFELELQDTGDSVCDVDGVATKSAAGDDEL